jgi:hypothetical protein
MKPITKRQTLDSNNFKTKIHQVCSPCGTTANYLTCLQRYGQPPLQAHFSVSTYGKGICDFCKREADVTQTRDFFYPDFGLIEEFKKEHFIPAVLKEIEKGE